MKRKGDELGRKLQRFSDIVRDFVNVATDFEFMAYGIPDKLLPHPKKDIGEALEFWILYCALIKDRKKAEAYRNAYVNLARFIPSKEYAKVKCLYGSSIPMTRSQFKKVSSRNKGYKRVLAVLLKEVETRKKKAYSLMQQAQGEAKSSWGKGKLIKLL
ncbi:hypothetical protein ACFLZ3_00505 [Candidatus Omnitrophota bacterium]